MKTLLVGMFSITLLSACAYQEGVLAENPPPSQSVSSQSTTIQMPQKPNPALHHAPSSTAAGAASRMISPIVGQ